MIEMWDEAFAQMDPKVRTLIGEERPLEAFDLMHEALDQAWTQVKRVLIPGGIACINIGDATRTIGNRFRMYPNADRITLAFLRLGFDVLPKIIWRKTTNAPNKFMGSGMLPSGAYVTLEHEYILIFRNGAKRAFTDADEVRLRYESAVFWEERNNWYSDVWFGLNGAKQSLSARSRPRNGAFPVELPYRLINMFSVKGETVLDPFLGTGTTLLAAIAAGRNSVGIEIDPAFATLASERVLAEWEPLNELVDGRLVNHAQFVEEARKNGRDLRYFNSKISMPVMTRQEEQLSFQWIEEVKVRGERIDVNHAAVRPVRSAGLVEQLDLFQT